MSFPQMPAHALLASAPILLALAACGGHEKGVTVHNSAPNGSIESPVDGASFVEGESIDFMGTVGDSEDHARDLVVTWSSDADGVLQTGIPPDDDGTTYLTTGALSPGEHSIVLHVADPKGKSGEDTLSILVVDADAAPEINILRPSDDDVGLETQDFAFEAVVSDADDPGPAMDVAFWVHLEGEETLLCEATPNSDGLASCDAPVDVGTHDIVATVVDSDGNLDEDRFNDFVVLAYDEVDDDGDGFSEADGDCDDADDNIHPDAIEVANGIDDNCDGYIDEGTDDFDDDGDGFSELGGDCNDEDSTIYPGADEALNEVDDDCDGDVDEGTEAYDDDGDCYCETAPCTDSAVTDCETLEEGDCDDGDEDIHPDADETCDDVDNDCDGDVDADDADTDADGDGYSACDSEDCDDSDADVHPAATEVCDGIDNDCSGSADEDSAADASLWYPDVDGDGYGDPDAHTVSCDAPEGYIADHTDCDDLDEDVHPYATEVCDSLDTDEDCDGEADDDDSSGASGKSMWYRDLDGDGYGDSSVWTTACDAIDGYVSNNDDCDDWNDAAYPGRSETCDGADNNCDGEVDEEDSIGCESYYLDEDWDGYGHETDRRCLCEADFWSGYDATNNEDCCDVSSSSYPGATAWHESANACGSHDWNCDGENERQWETTGECSSGFSTDLCYDDPAGWVYGYVPACGSSWGWLTDCDLECEWWDCSCVPVYDMRDQSCR